MKSTSFIQRLAINTVCTSCQAINRIPDNRIQEAAKCGRCGHDLFDGEVTNATGETLDKLLKDDLPVVIDFRAPWCGPCRNFAPIFEGVAEGRSSKARFVKANTEAERELSARSGIRNTPTIMIFKKREIVDMLNGAVPKTPFDSWLNESLQPLRGVSCAPFSPLRQWRSSTCLPMTDNAVLQLRAERLTCATRPFLARGNRIRRCQRCLLPQELYLCATLAPSEAKSRFCLVVFDTEPMKPSNTGRLTVDILPDTTAFQWSRTEPSQVLLELAKNPDYQPMVVFPAPYAGKEHKVIFMLPTGKPPLFIMLDDIWPEARKMFRENPYLDNLPMISVDLSRLSAHNLCGVHTEGQYCTVEVAIALLDLAGDTQAAEGLSDHSTRFKIRYLTGKTQHQESVTADSSENV